MDATLIDAWAGTKSFRWKDRSDVQPPDDPGNPTMNFHGERRSNTTHHSTTDPDARLYRKGDRREARLCYLGHVLMENRHGLVVDTEISLATGTAERDMAWDLAVRRPPGRRVTLGADKAYDVRGFVAALRALEVTPHVP